MLPNTNAYLYCVDSHLCRIWQNHLYIFLSLLNEKKKQPQSSLNALQVCFYSPASRALIDSSKYEKVER